jgi:hypothetical protein
MAFSYDLTMDRGKVRFLIDDADYSDYELEDAEIDYFLTRSGSSVNAAAVEACFWLARKYAKKASFTADGLSIQNGQKAQIFAERAKELQIQAIGGVTSVAITRTDGYSEAASSSEYETAHKIIYIDTD